MTYIFLFPLVEHLLFLLSIVKPVVVQVSRQNSRCAAMHSIGLISTFFAVVALVSSGPIDPSVDSYDPASDGGELAYVEAVNPDLDNVASG